MGHLSTCHDNPPESIPHRGDGLAVIRFTRTELAFRLREGPHLHHPEDWRVLFDFIRWKWFGKQPGSRYNEHPYTHLPHLSFG